MEAITYLPGAVVDILSYRGVFYDHPKLHPGFRLGDVLLVLTNTRPKLTPFVKIAASQIDSKHFRSRNKYVYVTYAYDQEADRFNNIVGGKLRLSDINLLKLEATFRLPDDWRAFLTFSKRFNMFKSISMDDNLFVLLADAGAFTHSKDLAEFGLSGRVKGGIKGLEKPGVDCKNPGAILKYFNDTLAPGVIDGTKQLPATHPLYVELQEQFLPSILTIALEKLLPQLTGKAQAEGTLSADKVAENVNKLKESAAAAVEAKADPKTPADQITALKEAAQYQAIAGLVMDLQALYNGEQTDEVALRLSEAFDIPVDKVFEVAAADVDTIVDAIDANTAAAAAVDVDSVEAEATSVVEAEAENTATVETSVIPANVAQVRRLARGAEALAAMATYVAAEVAVIKKDQEEAAGLPVEEIKPVAADALPAAVE